MTTSQLNKGTNSATTFRKKVCNPKPYKKFAPPILAMIFRPNFGRLKSWEVVVFERYFSIPMTVLSLLFNWTLLWLAPFPVPQSVLHNQAALPLPDRPSIVVLPFVNMSGDPNQDYFSDGITEVLTGDLSRIASLFVIARNTAFTYKGKAVNVQDVGRELGVRYVLEGSVQRAGEQVRIVAQLIDTTTSAHLWSERFDRPLKDIFAVQDEVVQKIVTTLKLQLTLLEQGYIVRKLTNSLEAYDYVLRGTASFWRFTKEGNLQARQMIEKAIELDPQYVAGYAALGWTYFLEWFFRWSSDPQNLDRAFELAQRAITLDDSLPLAHSLLSFVYQQKGQSEQALAEGKRAIALNPNSADGYVGLAAVLNNMGRPEEALPLIERALRLNPPPDAGKDWYFNSIGSAYYLAGQTEEAIAPLKRLLAQFPNHLGAHLILAAVYSDLGKEAEARAEAAEVLRINPKFSLEVHKQRVPIKDSAMLERHLTALHKAGLK